MPACWARGDANSCTRRTLASVGMWDPSGYISEAAPPLAIAAGPDRGPKDRDGPSNRSFAAASNRALALMNLSLADWGATAAGALGRGDSMSRAKMLAAA
jgi:hypothetical protein